MSLINHYLSNMNIITFFTKYMNKNDYINKKMIELGIINYEINNNLINVNGDVNLSKKRLSNLPFQFGDINGDLNIANNKFTNLDGLFKSCNNLYANNNLINNLSGMGYIKRNIDLSHNKITTLKGIQPIIDGSLLLNNNRLSNLKDGPIKIVNDFNVSDNKITSLIEMPKSVNIFYIDNNNVKNLKHLTHIMNSLKINNNKITTLEHLPEKIEFDLYLSKNNISNINITLISNGTIDLTFNKITEYNKSFIECYNLITDDLHIKSIIYNNLISKKNYNELIIDISNINKKTFKKL